MREENSNLLTPVVVRRVGGAALPFGEWFVYLRRVFPVAFAVSEGGKSMVSESVAAEEWDGMGHCRHQHDWEAYMMPSTEDSVGQGARVVSARLCCVRECVPYGLSSCVVLR
jgi:hypothetical protein